MENKIASAKNYTTILDAVYQREAVSTALNSPARLMRAGKNAKEIMIPKIEVTGLGDYTRNVGYRSRWPWRRSSSATCHQPQRDFPPRNFSSSRVQNLGTGLCEPERHPGRAG